MRNAIIKALTLALCACGGGSSGGGPDGAPPADPDAGRQAPDAGGPAPPALTIVLSFEGETLNSGAMEDATTNTTPILLSGSASIPSFDDAVMNTSKARSEIIADVVDATAALFAPFDVAVQTDRPASGDYALVVIGGEASDAGAPFGTANYGLIDCGDENPSIGIVFTDEDGVLAGGAAGELSYEEQVERLSVLAAATAGSGLGLDAVMDCRDVMANVFTCSEAQQFIDEELTCGLDEPKDCACGGTTQNSVQAIQAALAP